MAINTSPKYLGEPTAKSLAGGLATLGRYGDNYMVHAAEGETIIPREILDENPGLKDDLFSQMAMMGIKDPNRYVVGNELNSLNPITGQPEFFFKKLWKATKKILGSPIVTSFIGNLVAPGVGGIVLPAAVAAAKGENLEKVGLDALMGYGQQAITRGLSSDDFGKGFMTGLKEPFVAGTNLLQGTPLGGDDAGLNPLAQGVLGSRGMNVLFSDLGVTPEDPFFTGFAEDEVIPESAFGAKELGWFPSYESGIGRYQDATGGMLSTAGANAAEVRAYNRRHGVSLPPKTQIIDGKPYVEGRLIEVKEKTLPLPKGVKYADTSPAGEQSWVKQAAFPLGASALAYGLTKDPPSDAEVLAQLDESRTGEQQKAFSDWQKIADKTSPEAQRLRLIWYGAPKHTGTELASKFGANPLTGITAAGGGEVIGPGTGTSDSIPARLSNGEFVMTAEAVRNAGNGDRSLGAARMYDMMNRFERGMV